MLSGLKRMLQTQPHNVHALCLALVLHGHGSRGHRSWGGCHVMGLKHRSQVSMILNDENFVHLSSGCSQPASQAASFIQITGLVGSEVVFSLCPQVCDVAP